MREIKMLESIYEIYEPANLVFRKAKKQTYETRMDEFRKEYGHYFKEMIEYVNGADDQDAARKEVSEIFTDNMFNHFAKNGKVRGAMHSDLCLYMVYYVFPALLLEEDAKTSPLADALRDAWVSKFNNKGMGYITYQDVYDNFKEKIFGIF